VIWHRAVVLIEEAVAAVLAQVPEPPDTRPSLIGIEQLLDPAGLADLVVPGR
jgi:hypothetical protein